MTTPQICSGYKTKDARESYPKNQSGLPEEGVCLSGPFLDTVITEYIQGNSTQTEQNFWEKNQRPV